MRHKIKFMLSAILLIAMAFTGCRKMYDQVMEGIQVSYNVNSFLAHQMVVQMVNANEKSSVKPNAVITIEGRDAGRVFDINGAPSIEVNNGVAQLVVSPGQPLNGNLSFTIRATAPGFMDYEKEVVITPKDSVSNYILPMVERLNAPDGIKVEGLDFEVLSTTSTTSTSFNIPLPLDQNVTSPQFSSLLIATGTKFLDAANKAISGTITTTFTRHNTTDEVIATENPFNSKSATNNLGTATAVTFSPISILNIRMTGSGSKVVSTLSTPMQVRLEISNNTYNLVTQANYLLNSQVEVYGRFTGATSWTLVTTATFNQSVTASPLSRLATTVSLTRTGSYAFLPKVTRATTALALTFSRSTSVRTSHFLLVTDANDKKLFSYDQVPVRNGGTFTLPDFLPAARAAKLKVYEYDFAGNLKGRMVAEFPITAGATSLAVALNPQAQLLPVTGYTSNLLLKFQLTATCAGSTAINQPYQGSILYKRNAADARYYTMGESSATGYLETDRLLFDTSYIFRTTVTAPHNRTKKLVTTTYERPRIVYKDKKRDDNGPGGFDIDHEVIGYFTFQALSVAPGPYNWESWTFVKRSAVNGTAQNWIVPSTACATYGY